MPGSTGTDSLIASCECSACTQDFPERQDTRTPWRHRARHGHTLPDKHTPTYTQAWCLPQEALRAAHAHSLSEKHAVACRARLAALCAACDRPPAAGLQRTRGSGCGGMPAGLPLPAPTIATGALAECAGAGRFSFRPAVAHMEAACGRAPRPGAPPPHAWARQWAPCRLTPGAAPPGCAAGARWPSTPRCGAPALAAGAPPRPPGAAPRPSGAAPRPPGAPPRPGDAAPRPFGAPQQPWPGVGQVPGAPRPPGAPQQPWLGAGQVPGVAHACGLPAQGPPACRARPGGHCAAARGPGVPAAGLPRSPHAPGAECGCRLRCPPAGAVAASAALPSTRRSATALAGGRDWRSAGRAAGPADAQAWACAPRAPSLCGSQLAQGAGPGACRHASYAALTACITVLRSAPLQHRSCKPLCRIIAAQWGQPQTGL